ncbi:MAG: zinc dependent phospholipase C family protein, partial [Clostridia bacterium]|nr:zinc dependent phospholipase C family protein [Clostridia bacterium]
LGDTLHRKKTGAFLLNGFSRLKNVSYDEGWMDLAVYLCGFICHFTLDRMIHPYVYWASDQWIWAVDGTPRKVTHQQVEISLDVLYWREAKGTPAYKVRTRKLVDIGAEWPESVALFLESSFKALYGIEADENELNKVLKDFYRGHDLLFDPKGWKKALVNGLDSLTGGGIRPPKPPYPVVYDSEIDWANRKNRMWESPFDDTEVYEISMDKLLAEAADTAAIHINTIFSRLFKSEGIEDLFPDLSYDTGMACIYEDKE